MILAVDVGGTHADGVLLVKNENDCSLFASEKIPLAGRGVKEAVINLLAELTGQFDQSSESSLNRAVISTTLATNAITENKTAPVGLILIPGPGLNPEYCKFGEANRVISGYTDHRGEIVQNISRQEVIDAAEDFSSRGIEDIAIAGKFSVRNPQQEIQAKNWLQESDLNFSSISLGHKLSPGLNFPRRAAMVCCNAAIKKLQNQFKHDIEKVLSPYLERGNLYFLKSDGGTMKAEEIEKNPVKAVNSGPAASILGAMSYLISDVDNNSDKKAERTSLLLDIGGTTTDISLFVQGEPLFEPGGIMIKNWHTLVRGLFSRSVAAGGDSKIRVEGGEIKIGPERKGPAAALGGPALTPTDAVLLLREKNIINTGDKLVTAGGTIDYRKAARKFRALAEKLETICGLSELKSDSFNTVLSTFSSSSPAKTAISSLEPADKAAILSLDALTEKISQACEKIMAELAGQPVYTIEELLQDFQINPDSVLGMGGPARQIVPAVAEKLDLRVEILPRARVANAIGAGCARPTYSVTVRADTKIGKVVVPERGIRRDIKSDERFDTDKAVKMAENLIRDDYPGVVPDIEITSRESYPTVSGFRTTGEIIEVEAQVNPGLMGDFAWLEEADKDEGN